MSLPTKFIGATQLLLGLFGGYAVWVISNQNGFFDLNVSLTEKGQLPGSPDAILIREYTGFPPLDMLLQLYTVFYWPLCHGHPPGLSLLSILTGTGVAVMWALITVETSRTQALARTLFKMGLLGVCLLVLGPAIVISFYCAWDFLSISSSRSPPTPSPTHPHLRQHFGGLLVTVYCTLVILMSLSSPTVVSHDFKQIMIVIFQGWPLYVSILLWATTLTCNCARPEEAKTSAHESIYLWMMCFATIAHLVPLSISIFSNDAEMRPGDVYLPSLPWSGKPLSSLEDGLHRFFQWENLIGCFAGLLWAMAKYVHHCKQQGTTLHYWKLVPEAMLLSIVMSPYGAASWYLSKQEPPSSIFLVEKDKGNI